MYTELSRLEGLAWATGTEVQQDRCPNKRIYEPIRAGRDALREWLDSANEGQQQRTQDSMLLKTFLGEYMSRERLADHLRDHREQAEKLRAELLATVGHLDAKPSAGPHRFGRATARYGVLQWEARDAANRRLVRSGCPSRGSPT